MHTAICWPAMSDTSLWPIAVNYAVHHHNHMPHPNVGMMSPIDLDLKTQVSQSHFVICTCGDAHAMSLSLPFKMATSYQNGSLIVIVAFLLVLPSSLLSCATHPQHPYLKDFSSGSCHF